MQSFEVIFYEKGDGTEPVKDFLLSLDIKMRAKMTRMIALLEMYGVSLRMPYSEFLDDGSFELRAQVGSDISRVLYFFVVGQRIILTNGFIKKSQKTPPAEIQRAKRYREDYLSKDKR